MKKSALLIAGAVAVLAVAAVYACPTCGCAAKKGAKSGGTGGLSTAELAKLVDSGSAVILDARSGKYDDGRRIPGAKGVGTKPSKDEVATFVTKKDTLVVTYCTNPKCPASGMLGKRLRDYGYTNVKEYHHGIEGWVDAGKTFDTAKK
jgi:rhodanese-related sulfurtransferase